MSDQQRNAIERERHNLQPTPPIGLPVQWYKGGDIREVRAARVIGVEGPGRLILAIDSVDQMAKHQKGVLHVSNSTHEVLNNPTTVRCGSWDYIPGERKSIPAAHLALHEEQLAKRLEIIEKAEEHAKQQAARRAKQQEQFQQLQPETRKLISKETSEVA